VTQHIRAIVFILFVVSTIPVGAAFAQELTPSHGAHEAAIATAPGVAPEPRVDKGDTAWILTSSALVLMMTIPGLFLFYGGLVRGKNVLGTIMQSFVVVALISIQWVLWGYTLAFGPEHDGATLRRKEEPHDSHAVQRARVSHHRSPVSLQW